jgi:hypothetical protein
VPLLAIRAGTGSSASVRIPAGATAATLGHAAFALSANEQPDREAHHVREGTIGSTAAFAEEFTEAVTPRRGGAHLWHSPTGNRSPPFDTPASRRLRSKPHLSHQAGEGQDRRRSSLGPPAFYTSGVTARGCGGTQQSSSCRCIVLDELDPDIHARSSRYH